MEEDCQEEMVLKMGTKRPVDLRKEPYLLNILYKFDMGVFGQYGLFRLKFFHLSEEGLARYAQKVCSFAPVPVGLAQCF